MQFTRCFHEPTIGLDGRLSLSAWREFGGNLRLHFRLTVHCTHGLLSYQVWNPSCRMEETLSNLTLTEDDDSLSSGELQQRQQDTKAFKRAGELEKVFEATRGPDGVSPAESREFPSNVTFTFKVRNRQLTDLNSVYECNAWDDVTWDEELEQQARDAVSKNSQSFVDPDKVGVLERDAHSFWDKFYGIHQNKFFRDRNWLFYEFPELESPFGCSVSAEESTKGIESKRQGESYPGENSAFKVLEIGCGVGNTVFPLLNANNHPETYVYCCDFSAVAVNIIKNHDKFEPHRCTPFVLDVTDKNPTTPFPPGTIDVITSIFVVSAISPEKFDRCVRNILSFLKPGGLLLFRDYGRYDMAQLRFKDGRCLSDNFYMRGDGTRVYFFLQEEIENLFVRNGFIKDDIYVDRRLQVNRSRQLKMYRVWIQAKFRKPDTTCSKDN